VVPVFDSRTAVAKKKKEKEMAGTNHTGRPFYTCKEVSTLCPVEATTLGYYPIKGLNIFFALGFGLSGLITLVLGTWKKTWSYMAFVTAGAFLELAGMLSIYENTIVLLGFS
jgi:hypothetical protein